jgi:hypothetical protein
MNKTKVYQITPYDHFLLAKEVYVYWLSGTVVYFVVQYFNNSVTISLYYWILVVLLTIQTIPALFLHFQYYRLNKGLVVWINPTDHTIGFTDKSVNCKYDIPQITRVEMVLSYAPFVNEKRGLYLWERYYFSAVEFEGGCTILLTSLLVDDLKDIFTQYGIDVKKERVIFPIIPV